MAALLEVVGVLAMRGRGAEYVVVAVLGVLGLGELGGAEELLAEHAQSLDDPLGLASDDDGALVDVGVLLLLDDLHVSAGLLVDVLDVLAVLADDEADEVAAEGELQDDDLAVLRAGEREAGDTTVPSSMPFLTIASMVSLARMTFLQLPERSMARTFRPETMSFSLESWILHSELLAIYGWQRAARHTSLILLPPLPMTRPTAPWGMSMRMSMLSV